MKCRVLQVASSLPNWAGTERYVLDISVGLANHGHRVALACPAGSALHERAGQCGIPCVALELHKSNEWRQLPKFLQVITGKYDVVHTHSLIDYVVPALAARVARTPAVIMTRHLPHSFASKWNAYLCTNLFYDRSIAISEFIRRVMIESGATPDRVTVVLNGISPIVPDPTARDRLRKEMGLPAGAFLIAAAGRLAPEKGFDVLLKALERVIATGVRPYCVIFGSGRMHAELEFLANRLGISPFVKLPGFRNDVFDLWRAADIAVIPSVWPEPFGYTALEALSAGCALVVSRAGALPEVVSSECASLTEPGDVDGLAAAIRKLMLSPELRCQMAVAARKRAEFFTLQANILGVEEVYEQVLHPRNNGIHAS